MLYPSEASQLFPIPLKSSIGSDIISISTQIEGSAESTKSKKVAVFQFASVSRRLADDLTIPTMLAINWCKDAVDSSNCICLCPGQDAGALVMVIACYVRHYC